MDLNLFFPTILGSLINPLHDKIQDKLIKHCLEIKKNIKPGGNGWLSNKTYNTSDGKYDLTTDSEFEEINKWVNNNVHEYCKQLQIHTETLSDNGSWFNIYEQNDFQEIHVHPTSVISAIYILTCSENGARIFFNSPVNNMYYVKKTVKKQEMADQVICNSTPGTLIIFPSYLPHAVERHETDTLRISFSYNYKQ
jgi:uncharacterized protein (TIGR02466 family)